MSFGRADRLSLPTPMPIAPDETRMISCPAFFRSLSTLHSRSIRWIFSRPVACANVDVPTLTTIRIMIPLIYKNAAIIAHCAQNCICFCLCCAKESEIFTAYHTINYVGVAQKAAPTMISVSCALSRRTAAWTGSGRRCPAEARRWSCPYSPDAWPTRLPPRRQRRRRCRPAHPPCGRSAGRSQTHPHC